MPLDTTSCFIIEPATSPETSQVFRLLPIGEDGELALGGHQLAEGYINRPDQTSSAFITSPYGRVYRTGDRARITVDGTLECLGRLSEGQVKLRGQRIELGEIQHAVLRTSGCHGAVAAVVDSILVVFCVVDTSVTDREVLASCSNWLPRFMVPGEFVLMKDFPRLPSGKVDIRRLKAEFKDEKSAKQYNKNDSIVLSDTEKTALCVTSEVLGVEAQLQMTLASSGLDSLLIIKLASALRNAGFQADVADLLNCKTIHDLCCSVRLNTMTSLTISKQVNPSLLADLDLILANDKALQLRAHEIEDILRCTPLQMAMLAESSLHPITYWNEVEWELTTGATASEIREAILQLALRNESLRAGFIPWRGGFVSPVFEALCDHQIEIVKGFKYLSTSGNADDLLSPFRIQILDNGSDLGIRVLVHIHHAIYDGWSMDMMLSDLSKLIRGKQVPSRCQFRNVISNILEGSNSRADIDRAFWAEYLLGWNKTPFPKLRSRLGESNEPMILRETLDIPVEFVENAARRSGLSPQVYFQASLASLWSSISGSSDVLIGSVTSGRSLSVEGIDAIIGPCIASLPLRVDFSRLMTGHDVLMSIKTSNRKILTHCSLSLSDIKRLVGLQGAESVYDVLFVYQQSLGTKLCSDNLIKEVRHMDRLETKLLVEVEPSEEGFVIQATYHEKSVTLEMVRHLIRQMTSILKKLIIKPEESIKTIKQPSGNGLSIDNKLIEEFCGPTDLASAFECMATANPSADAICFRTSLATGSTGSIMSFGELNKMANRIARFLRSQGSQPGQIVAIIMEKSPMLYALILGIIKARCAYLPLLPSTPIDRVNEIFGSAKVKKCVVDSNSLLKLRHIDAVNFFNYESMALERFPEHNLEIPADESRLAYVIYTSGTTGTPKGVAVTDRNIVSNISYLASIYPLRTATPPRLLQACSQAFDVSVFEIFFTWHAGMCLCAATNDVLFGNLELAIQQFKITHLSLTPTVASLINPQSVPSVEFLVTAGEPMTSKVLETWGKLLWQGYGPSETTNICSVKKMSRGEHIEHLGWVFSNTSVFVLEPENLEVVPFGWVGEFCFGGDQVAHGYLNMPSITAEKFIEHPEFGRIYRSGDMGRMLPDGSLIILGRIDDQVKLRGQRIETGEVNSIITSVSSVISAVTIMIRRGDQGTEKLSSFYVRRRADDVFQVLDVDSEIHNSLFAKLESRLPAYMIPAYLIPVSCIPLTSSGKVDRRYLLEAFANLPQKYVELVSNIDTNQVDDAEWTRDEVVLAKFITQSLNLSRSDVGRWTPFSTLGLDSISAIGVARDLSSEYSSQVPVSAILQNPTVAQLARFLDEAPRHNKGQRRETFFSDTFINSLRDEFEGKPEKITQIYPCSPLQEAMLSSGQGSYYNKILLRLHTKPEEMKRYWEEMTRRHGVLRTCFMTTSDAEYPIAQVTLDHWNIAWKTFDVTVPSLDGAIYEHLRNLPEPLDSKMPPLSLALIRYRGSSFLSFICHHSLYDGVAMENLWREVEALANGNDLPPPVSYGPFIQEVLNLPKDTEQFWTEHFRGFSPTLLFPSSTRQHIDQSIHTISLDMPFREIQEKMRNLGVSILSLSQASWANVLAVSCNMLDACFGTVLSGRTLGLEGLERLVAPCFNTIPVRADLSTSAQNIELVKSFQRLNSDVLPYQFTPLRLVQKITNHHGRRLFDTILLVQRPLQDMDSRVWTLEEDSGEMDIPLVCEVVPCPNLNSVFLNLHYDMGIVTAEIAAALADLFRQIFRHILTCPFALSADRGCKELTISPLLNVLASRKQKKDLNNRYQDNKEYWTEIETIVRKILADLSNTPPENIDRHTSIFQLGLDSINAVQVASMLRRQGFIVSSSDVIECPTCARLASRLKEKPRENISEPTRYDLARFASQVSSQVKQILPSELAVEMTLPCTPMQSAMLASFVQSTGKNYLNLVSYTLDDMVQMDALVAAWKSLYGQHPMLRTGFVPVQHQDSAFAMVRYKIEAMDAPIILIQKDQDSNLSRLQSKDNVAKDILEALHMPPWRVIIARRDGQLMMDLIAHHALYDAQSLDAIFTILSMLLQGQNNHSLRPVEPALSSIMAQTSNEDGQDMMFWKEKADYAVVNSFPLMTPLREEKRAVLVYEMISTLPFSRFQKETRNQSVSIQAVLQAAWARILSSYLGEDSVVFGVTLSGRTTDETQDAPFPCLTTVPIIAINKSSNSELVKDMMEYNKTMHTYQFAPLSKIQKWLGHPGVPVFDTILVYQKTDRRQNPTRPWKLNLDNAMVDYPVSLEIEPIDGDKIRLCATYFDDVLPREQAELLVNQFDAVMNHLVTHPDGDEDGVYQNKPHLFAITPAISPELSTSVDFVHQFVEEKAVSQPDTIALEFVSSFDGSVPVMRTWTYRELNELGNKVANMLKDQAAVGSIVAIYFDKCPEAYISILGIMKAGCAFVALDPSAPKSRKEFIMSDSLAPCLLTSTGTQLEFDVPVKVIRVDVDAVHRYSLDCRDLGSAFTPSNTCYCLYTSGTTGTPKGCEITHENTVQAMMAFQELFQGHWSVDSRWLQFAALHFDVSVLEQYWSWSVGITLVAAPKELILDDLLASINRLKITHIDLTPSLARLTHPDDVPSLCKGVFITGGEQLKQEILDAWGPKAVIYNAYGPTEATIGVTTYQRVPINGRPSNIGKQFSNVGSYVFRRGTEIPVLRGGVGELCVSGKLVGKGYLNRPELTKERFPTLSEFGERVYQTGDLVRILYDGCFEFLGRADDQVKLRGQRLEIGEINHTIRTGATEVNDVATLVVKHGSSGKDVIVSFLVGQVMKEQSLTVLQNGNELAIKARDACRNKLPGYMIPTYFLNLPFIPLSPNNKVEAKELKKLFNDLSHEQLMALTAVNSIRQGVNHEAAEGIINVISDYCHIEKTRIGRNTSIFDIGVDSITALQLSMLLKKRGFKAASPFVLLRNPIIADLVTELSKSGSNNSQDSFVREARQLIQACRHRHLATITRTLGVGLEDIEYIAPCSPLQQGIISKSLTGKVSGQYFNSFELMLGDNISKERLQHAWHDLIMSHGILRIAFVNTTDGCVQVALKNPTMPWEECDVENLMEMNSFLDNKKQQWVQQNGDHITTPLQLLLIHGPTFTKLVIHVFHALYDGNSFNLMLQWVRAKYLSEPVVPAPQFIKALTYGPLWSHLGCRQFWNTHLDGWNKFSLLQPQFESSKDIAIASITIHSRQLEKARQKHNVTLQSVMMAVWVSVLQKHYPDGLTLGIIISGRAIDLPNVDHTIGPLFNTLPFFNKSLHEHDWSSLVRKCHEYNTSVLSFQHVPLQSVQKWISSGRPLFDNLFTFEVEQSSPIEGPELWSVTDGSPNPDYPLAFEAKKMCNGDVQLSLLAQGHFFDSLELKKMLDQVDININSIATEGTLQSSDTEKSAGLENSQRKVQSIEIKENTDAHFEWNVSASTIRNQMAILAGLSVEDISANKTVLELGLDSIDVIQLSTRLRAQGIHISASQIMRQQNISSMTHLLEVTAEALPAPEYLENGQFENTKQQLWDHVKMTGVNMDDVETVLPPTPLQESMVAGMVHSDFVWYFNHDLVEVAEGVDMARLRDAWMKVIEKSPVLRTGFLEVDDRQLDLAYCQVVYKKWNSTIGETQAADSLEASEDLIQHATWKAMEGKAADALFQLTFVSCGYRTLFLVSIAHALYDGWSLDLMYRDLAAAYDGELGSRVSAEFFLRRLFACNTDDANLFWADYLSGVSPTLISENAAKTVPEPFDVVYRQEIHSMISSQKLSEFCKSQKISLQVLCQACWAMVLAHRTKSLDVCFGVVLSGRDFEASEELMFPTMNTIPLRCILHGSIATFLAYLESSMVDIRDHQAFPLRKALASAQLPGTELFNSLFMMQKSAARVSSRQLLGSVNGKSAVEYPVCIEAETVKDSLVWRSACQERVCAEAGALELLRDLDQVLKLIIGSAATDVLTFQGAGVSICGLPCIRVKNDGTANAATTVDNAISSSGDNAVDWEPTMLTIRTMLSHVSSIPVEAIKASNCLYHLGLDSISAIKVSSLLRKEGVQLKPHDLVRATSITQMAKLASQPPQAHYRQERSDKVLTGWQAPQDIAIDDVLEAHNISRRDDVELVLPALPMQVYMLSAWQNEQGSVFFPDFQYAINWASRTVEQAHTAWDTLVAQTPILRTCFIATRSTETPFIQVTLRRERVDGDNPALRPLVHFEAAIEEDDEQRRLLIRLRIHHALYDGVSLPEIMRRFATLLVDGRDAHVAHNRDIIQRAWGQHVIRPTEQNARRVRKAFWLEYLRGYRPMIPNEAPPTVEKTGRVSYLKRCALDATRLRRVAAQNGVSIQALFFAAYSRALIAERREASSLLDEDVDEVGKKKEEEDDSSVVFGIYLANRAGNESLPLTYPTLNLVPLRVRSPASSHASLIEVAKGIQQDIHAISSQGRADVGLWEVAAWTGVKITSFVNFLTLFEDQDQQPSEDAAPIPSEASGQVHPKQQQQRPALTLVPPAEHKGGVLLEQASPDVVDLAKDTGALSLLSESWIQDNIVRDAFPVSFIYLVFLPPFTSSLVHFLTYLK